MRALEPTLASGAAAALLHCLDPTLGLDGAAAAGAAALPARAGHPHAVHRGREGALGVLGALPEALVQRRLDARVLREGVVHADVVLTVQAVQRQTDVEGGGVESQ